MGAASSNGPGVRRASTRRTRPRPPRAGSIPQAGLRAREWKPALPVPRLPMRVHSGVLRHLTSPTVAGAAPDLRLAKAMRAPDSRLNHRNSGSHLRGAHGSRIGWGRLGSLRQSAERSATPRLASPRLQMANLHSLPPPGAGQASASPRAGAVNCRFLLPPGEGAPKGRMRVRGEAACHVWRACPGCQHVRHRASSRRYAWALPPYPHPNPSPSGRGASSTHLGLLKISRSWK
ncbi:hypothetical protein FHY25_002120 [Xanthomonas arboricola]|nr:hypothetical protein [Xanthomonas campestris]MCW2007539.1 hypothetical protein [Xanthomonas campestris]